jgi:hypothetical protein
MDYLLWRSESEDGFCAIMDPPVEDIWELDEGISRAAGFPSDVACKMNPDYPKDVQLADNLSGACVPVISDKLKALLEKEVKVNRIEYLPVKVLNHKGRVASKDYYIFNPLDVCDCIDVQKSGVEWNAINPNLISGCDQLVLKKKAIPPDYQVFRLKYWGYNILVRSDLIDKLNAAGLTGLDFLAPADYTGIE